MINLNTLEADIEAEIERAYMRGYEKCKEDYRDKGLVDVVEKELLPEQVRFPLAPGSLIDIGDKDITIKNNSGIKTLYLSVDKDMIGITK